jgi:hypothetical protein
MKLLRVLLVGLMAMTWGCGDDDTPSDAPDAGGDAGPEPFAPNAYCPGPECPDEPGVGALEVGAAAVDVSPIAWDDELDGWRVTYTGYELEVRDDEGNFVDHNGNGEFDGQWLAGFGNDRFATGQNDPQWSRAIALRHENTTLVLVAVDSIGLFKGELDLIRAAVADLDVHHVLIAATHSHQSRDTLGLWGPTQFEGGLDPEYMAYLREQVAQSIRDAVAALEPAHVQYASFRTRDLTVPPEGSPDGVERLHGDNRDPNIVDDGVHVMRFLAAEDEGRTIATLVNWAAHPEYMWHRNQRLSSDFPHYLRQAIEEGLSLPWGEEVPGVGGMAVFYPGALGGQIGPNRVQLADWEGNTLQTWEDEGAAEAVGEQLAYFVLDALGDDGGAVTDVTAEIGFKTRELLVPVRNTGYHVAFNFGIFDRELYGYDPELAITADNLPHVLTEVTVVDVGRAQLITTPGELHPELFVGGYDGSYTPEGQEIIQPTNEHPPDLSAAPGPPYLRDHARDDAEMVLLLGLGNDMIGYLVPEYNFVLHDSAPYLERAPGHHYEETNSPGHDTWPTLEADLVQLLQWSPE